MKTKIYIFLVLLAIIFGCKKNNDENGETSAWNLQVKTQQGDTFVLAKADFTFTATTFSAHVTTSRIGGGNLVKIFDISGQINTDSMIVTNCVLNLTDPVEVVTVSGRFKKLANTMSGSGTYSINQPPDTAIYNDYFVLTAQKQ